MGPSATRADPQSFDRFADDYDRYASLEPPVILEWLLAQLPGRGRRALDAGCGSEPSSPVPDSTRSVTPRPRLAPPA
jgi:hypothetical protein